MAGHGPAPKDSRRRSNEPERGEWTPAPGVGWQHGEVPRPPSGWSEHRIRKGTDIGPGPVPLLRASRDAWFTWMQAWYAAFWTPEDIPTLRQIARLYDQVERGEFQRMPELRHQMRSMGMTPAGQQDRRWRPRLDAVTVARTAEVERGSRDHLRVMGATDA